MDANWQDVNIVFKDLSPPLKGKKGRALKVEIILCRPELVSVNILIISFYWCLNRVSHPGGCRLNSIERSVKPDNDQRLPSRQDSS